MPHLLYPPSRPQSIGEVLDSAFRIFRATLLKCLTYGALVVIAGQLQNIYDLATGHPLRRFGGTDPVWWALYVAGTLIGLTLWNTTVLRQYAILTGAPVSAARCLSDGLRRLPGVLLLAIVVVAGMGVFLLLPLLLPPAYRLWGFIVALIPSSYVGVALSCSWTALLLARKGVISSLTYSVHLVSGNWWRVTAIYTVGIVLLLVFSLVGGVIAGVVVPLAGASDIAVITAVSTVMVVAMGAVATPFFAAFAIALFGDLQVRKEGSDLEQRMAEAIASTVSEP